jgi:hypothetical protein
MRKEFKTFLQLVILNTLVTHVGIPMQQIQPQLGLVTNPTLVSQHLGWRQPVTPLIA